jgi:hypothetical protein
MSHHVCKNFRKKERKKNKFCYLQKQKLNGMIFLVVVSRSSSFDLRERLPTIEEDYQSSVELERPSISTTSTRYLKGLLLFL